MVLDYMIATMRDYEKFEQGIEQGEEMRQQMLE